MTDLPAQRVLLECVAVIDQQGISYAVMGGFAVRAWGIPRPTFDADVAVVVNGEQWAALLSSLEAEGFDVPSEHSTGFLDKLGPFQKAKVSRFYEGFVWSTDLFIAGDSFLESAVSRARRAVIGGVTVRVMAPEDIVLLKLIAGRRKDLADIDEILMISTNIDRDYLDLWAARLGVADRLADILPREAPPNPDKGV